MKRENMHWKYKNNKNTQPTPQYSQGKSSWFKLHCKPVFLVDVLLVYR